MIKTRQQAYEDGEKTYITGRPCSRGHDNGRYTASGNCVGCHTRYGSSKKVIMCERGRAYMKQIILKVIDERDEQAIRDFVDAINEARHLTNTMEIEARAAAIREPQVHKTIHWTNEGNL